MMSAEMQTSKTTWYPPDTWSRDQVVTTSVGGKRRVIVPKHWFFNDWRAWNDGASSGEMAFRQFKDGFDFVLEEARRGKPGRVDALVHAELGGRPDMANAFEKMIRHIRQHDEMVWFPTRDEVADYMLRTSNYVEPYSPMG